MIFSSGDMWYCPHCGYDLQAEELVDMQVEELEEGEWFEAPEFSCCDAVYEYQQVQAEISELTDNTTYHHC
jgi:hypothetical protein